MYGVVVEIIMMRPVVSWGDHLGVEYVMRPGNVMGESIGQIPQAQMMGAIGLCCVDALLASAQCHVLCA